jgi:hypothetical protein
LRSADRKHDTSEPTPEEEEEEDSGDGRSRIWRRQERCSYVSSRKPYSTQWPPEPLIVGFASTILPTLSPSVSSTLSAREKAYSEGDLTALSQRWLLGCPQICNGLLQQPTDQSWKVRSSRLTATKKHIN